MQFGHLTCEKFQLPNYPQYEFYISPGVKQKLKPHIINDILTYFASRPDGLPARQRYFNITVTLLIEPPRSYQGCGLVQLVPQKMTLYLGEYSGAYWLMTPEEFNAVCADEAD